MRVYFLSRNPRVLLAIGLLMRNSRLEMIVVAGCVGLGFAVWENLSYFAQYGSAVAFPRFLTANFFHFAGHPFPAGDHLGRSGHDDFPGGYPKLAFERTIPFMIPSRNSIRNCGPLPTARAVMKRMTLANYQNDQLYTGVAKAVAEILATTDVVAPLDVLLTSHTFTHQ